MSTGLRQIREVPFDVPAMMRHDTINVTTVKAAVHWLCVGAIIAEFNMGASVRAESARNHIAAHVKFGADCAIA